MLADRGRDFVDNEGGETETFLDEQEGLAKLLALVADNGPTRAGGVLPEHATKATTIDEVLLRLGKRLVLTICRVA